MLAVGQRTSFTFRVLSLSLCYPLGTNLSDSSLGFTEEFFNGHILEWCTHLLYNPLPAGCHLVHLPQAADIIDRDDPHGGAAVFLDQHPPFTARDTIDDAPEVLAYIGGGHDLGVRGEWICFRFSFSHGFLTCQIISDRSPQYCTKQYKMQSRIPVRFDRVRCIIAGRSIPAEAR